MTHDRITARTAAIVLTVAALLGGIAGACSAELPPTPSASSAAVHAGV